jgi:PKD repeat protein
VGIFVNTQTHAAVLSCERKYVMMRLHQILLSFALLFMASGALMAQQWATMMDEGHHNFYEIQAVFEDQWSGKETERGSGYKPFKRWEYFMEERVYPSGEFPAAGMRFSEFEKFMARTPQRTENNQRNGNWQSLGPFTWQSTNGWNPGIGRVNFITEEPNNPNTIYLGTPAGGLWRSEDAGSNWTPLTDDLPSMGVSGIAINPENPNIIYIATGDRDASDYMGVGVLKSTDYGQTWQTTGMNWQLSQGIKSNWLIMHPTDFNTLLLANNQGLYKTIDAGESWQLVQSGNIREVAYNVANPEIVYAVTNRFYRSENGGNSFTLINEGFPAPGEINRLSLAVTGANPDYVYALAGDEDSSGYRGLYRSIDGGLTFTERSDSPNILGYNSEGTSSGGQSWYDLALAASNSNASRIFTGGINVWRSSNAGTTFNALSQWTYPNNTGYTHADIHFLKTFESRLYCGSDGGIFISNDNGINWSDLSEGIAITQPYRFAVSEQNPYFILAGTQDNGTNLLIDGVFYHILGGDGNGAAMSADNQNVLYASYPYGSIEVSFDGGQSFEGISNEIEENGLWVTPYVLDPSNQNVLYAGYQNVWKFTVGSGWEQLSSFGGSSFRALAVAPSNNDYIYGSKGSVFYSTTNGGEEWINTGNTLPNFNITAIAVHPTNPSKVWITFSGYDQGNKVFTSNDAGLTWQNVSYNLPNIPHNAVVFEGEETGGIYVGTDAGIYYTNDSLASWVDFMDGLPKTVVNQMIISESIGKIRACTYGRGIWESDLYTQSNAEPEAAFSSNVQVVCVGDSIQFTDLSYNAAPGWNWQFEGGSPVLSDERDPIVFYNEEGVYSVSLSVSNSNGSSEASQEMYIVVLGTGLETPYEESFEDFENLMSNQWITLNNDQDITWQLNTAVGLESTKSVWIDNLNNSTGRIDELESPAFDLSGMGSATLTFKVAYAQINELNDDRLRVYISNNCGNSWNLRAQLKGTTNLATVPATDIAFVPTSAEEWQEVVLTNFPASYFGPNFRFKFEFTNDNGNNIYIDDINLISSPVSVQEIENLLNVDLYPNPARTQTQMIINLSKAETLNYSLLDARGVIINEFQLGSLPAGEHRVDIKTSNLARGMYFVQISNGQSQQALKLFVD